MEKKIQLARFPYTMRHKKIRKKFKFEGNSMILQRYVKHCLGYLYANYFCTWGLFKSPKLFWPFSLKMHFPYCKSAFDPW